MLTAVERLDLFVLTVMAALIAFLRASGASRAQMDLWLVAFVVLMVVTLVASRRGDDRLRLAVAGLVLLAVYESLGGVIAAIGAPLRDRQIIAVERWVKFDAVPPLAEWRIPSVVLDVFSVAYVVYFVLPVVLVAILLSRGNAARARSAALTLLITFYLHYALYLLVPVVGPVRTSEVPASVRVHLLAGGGSITHSVRRVVGALEGTPEDAFPSAHASVAALTAALAFRYRLRSRWVFAAIACAVIASTIVLGYHYVVDVAAALPVAGAAWYAGARVELGLRPLTAFRLRPARAD